MNTFKKIRLEGFSGLDFSSVQKCSFTLRSDPKSKNGDWAIDQMMDLYLQNANNVNPELGRPNITAIPADKGSVTDLEGAHYEVLDAANLIIALQKNIDDAAVARTAGKPVYTVIPAFNRVHEYVPGMKSASAAKPSVGGLSAFAAPSASDSPLV